MREFMDAIRRGEVAKVKELLDVDPSLLTARENNVSAILVAIYNGRPEVARLLVSRGAPVDLYDACALGDLDRVSSIIEADPSKASSRSADGFPAVGLAIFFGHPDIARLLIDRGADVGAPADNPMRVAPVHAAAAIGDREIMQLLLDRGADPNARQQMDFTALHDAASRGDVEMAKLLIAHGADPNAKTADGSTPADIAASRNHPEFVEWLIKFPA